MRDSTESEASGTGQSVGATAPVEPGEIARKLLERVRYGDPTEQLRRSLAEADEEALRPIRTERREALAFWLNLYNASSQLLLERRPELFESRWRFFRTPVATVAGVELSLDDIEHGVLRGNKSKYGLGYLPRLARTGLHSSYSAEPDPRIHFALNCGAASCPAILSYDSERIDETLDGATKSYFEQTVEYDAERNRVVVPRVCLWFVGDFGGPSGLRQFLRAFGTIPADSSPSIRFAAYDWTKEPRRFAE